MERVITIGNFIISIFSTLLPPRWSTLAHLGFRDPLESTKEEVSPMDPGGVMLVMYLIPFLGKMDANLMECDCQKPKKLNMEAARPRSGILIRLKLGKVESFPHGYRNVFSTITKLNMSMDWVLIMVFGFVSIPCNMCERKPINDLGICFQGSLGSDDMADGIIERVAMLGVEVLKRHS
ncbi:hypothetical protein PG988_007481 [Apiospora saccharicola]